MPLVKRQSIELVLSSSNSKISKLFDAIYSEVAYLDYEPIGTVIIMFIIMIITVHLGE